MNRWEPYPAVTMPALPGTRFHLVLSVLIALSLGVAGCASQRPLLYPNDQLRMVGPDAAEDDIAACMALAHDYGAGRGTGGKVAKDTATGAAVGGATGAAVGGVLGHLGKGAAAGAAGGAAGALTRSIIRSDDPDLVFRRFVERCLREKGYEPIGWQ